MIEGRYIFVSKIQEPKSKCYASLEKMMSPNVTIASISCKIKESKTIGRGEREIFTQGREYLESLLINWGKHQCDAYCLGAIIIKTFNIDTVFVL